MKTSLKGKYEYDKFYVHWIMISSMYMSGKQQTVVLLPQSCQDKDLLATSQSSPKVEGYALGLGLG